MATSTSKNAKLLLFVFVLTSLYLVAEVVGGVLTGSLALLADAGHMLTDVGGLGLALFAVKFAQRPPTTERTYGYYRTEILAAVVNAVALLGISAYVLYEAYRRLLTPSPVASVGMLAVACVGLVVNIIGIRLLRQDAGTSLNLKGAYFEVLSDLISSIGVILAGGIMWATGWYYADPIISAGIGLFIIPRTWALLRDAIAVLLEGAPATVNVTAVRSRILDVPGVVGVHDLHVWSLTSGMNAMSVHVAIAPSAPWAALLAEVQIVVTKEFDISHATVQIEPFGHQESETHL